MDLQIRDEDLTRLNPSVFTIEDEAEDLFESSLTAEKLMVLTGFKDLRNVKFLELKVDSRKTGLGDLAKCIPNVEQLKLNNSHTPCIRDLGSGYHHLTVLWMARCDLSDLDGIGSLNSLKELYLAYNQISDISSIGLLEDLEILDLESNDIIDLDQIENLSLCSNLHELTLEGNAIDFGNAIKNCDDLDELQVEARVVISKILPNLRILDDVPLKPDTHEDASTTKILERPTTSYGRSKSPSPMVPNERIITSRPITSHGRPSFVNQLEDTSSTLTFGMDSALGGNPVMLLRARRKQTQDVSSDPRRDAHSQVAFLSPTPRNREPSTNTLTPEISKTPRQPDVLVISPHPPTTPPSSGPGTALPEIKPTSASSARGRRIKFSNKPRTPDVETLSPRPPSEPPFRENKTPPLILLRAHRKPASPIATLGPITLSATASESVRLKT